MICPNCKNEIDAASKFCKYCGAEFLNEKISYADIEPDDSTLNTPPMQPSPFPTVTAYTPNQEKKVPIVPIVIVVILVLILGVLAIVGFKTNFFGLIDESTTDAEGNIIYDKDAEENSDGKAENATAEDASLSVSQIHDKELSSTAAPAFEDKTQKPSGSAENTTTSGAQGAASAGSQGSASTASQGSASTGSQGSTSSGSHGSASTGSQGSNTAEAQIKAFFNRSFYLTGILDENGESESITLAANGSNMEMKMTVEGLDELSVLSLNDKLYFKRPAKKQYAELTDTLADMLDMDISADLFDFDFGATSYDTMQKKLVSKNAVTVDGKNGICYKYVNENRTYEFYIVNNEIKQIHMADADGTDYTAFYLSTFSTTIPADQLTLKGYRKTSMLTMVMDMMDF